MQTFLPYKSFKKTAECLDYRRLGKQRVEAYQLVLLMCRPEQKAWRNHPAFKMWDGYDYALIDYGLTMCEEWKRRGYKDTLTEKFQELKNLVPYRNSNFPKWLGKQDFHASHRAALLYKNYDYYKQFNWKEEPKQEYVWNEGENNE